MGWSWFVFKTHQRTGLCCRHYSFPLVVGLESFGGPVDMLLVRTGGKCGRRPVAHRWSPSIISLQVTQPSSPTGAASISTSYMTYADILLLSNLNETNIMFSRALGSAARVVKFNSIGTVHAQNININFTKNLFGPQHTPVTLAFRSVYWFCINIYFFREHENLEKGTPNISIVRWVCRHERERKRQCDN
jgi:hypothetical protein